VKLSHGLFLILTLTLAGTLTGTVGFPLSASAAEYAKETVGPGEDLSAFSMRVYGTTKKWRDIYADNRDVIQNPNAVSPGTVLRVKITKKYTELKGGAPVTAAAAPTAQGQTGTFAAMETGTTEADVKDQTKRLSSEVKAVPADRSPAQETQSLPPKKRVALTTFKDFDVALAETQASKQVFEPKSKILVTESDGYIALLYGGTYNTSFQFVNFGLEGGYRFFSSLPNLTLGVHGLYTTYGTSQTGLGLYAMPRWFFSDANNNGFTAGLGLGYALRMTGTTAPVGLSVFPNVGYNFGIFSDFSLGVQAGAYMTFGSALTIVYTGQIGFQYNF
jgi:hypothetical protein